MELRRALLATGACGVLAATAVGCGNSSNDSSSTAADAPATTAAASTSGSTGEVELADSGLGQILVGGDGHTLYLFESDTSGDGSTCAGDCAAAWPPLTSRGRPKAGSGVDAAKLTTFKRDDGTTQVAYNGHPLYNYAEDEASGDTNGNDSDEFGGKWYAMTAAGDSVGDDEDSSSTTGSAGSGYSY